MTNGLMMDGWKDKRYAWRYMIGARGTSPVSYPLLDVVNTTTLFRDEAGLSTPCEVDNSDSVTPP
jgi:hypothetical protein